MRNRFLVAALMAALVIFPAAHAAAQADSQTQGSDQKIKGLLAEGLDREMDKRYPEAIMVYRRALKLDPNQPETLSKIGSCYERMGDLKNALKFYQQALQLKQDLPQARAYIEAHAPNAQATP